MGAYYDELCMSNSTFWKQKSTWNVEQLVKYLNYFQSKEYLKLLDMLFLTGFELKTDLESC